MELSDRRSPPSITLEEPVPVLRLYKRRWFILCAICIANISNTINQIMFTPIASKTAVFYSISYEYVNLLALVFFMLALPVGVIAFWLIDNFGIRPSVHVCVWTNLIGMKI